MHEWRPLSIHTLSVIHRVRCKQSTEVNGYCDTPLVIVIIALKTEWEGKSSTMTILAILEDVSVTACSCESQPEAIRGETTSAMVFLLSFLSFLFSVRLTLSFVPFELIPASCFVPRSLVRWIRLHGMVSLSRERCDALFLSQNTLEGEHVLGGPQKQKSHSRSAVVSSGCYVS